MTEKQHRNRSRRNSSPGRPRKKPESYNPKAVQAVELSPEDIATSRENFSALGLSDAGTAAAAGAGFIKPTEIQVEAIPKVCEGHDVMGLARTGSGKTAAFMLPNIGLRGAEGAPAVLVVVPTRELAIQVEEQTRLLGLKSNTRCVAVFGGVAMEQQVAMLAEGVDVIVATPGRLVDLRERGIVDLSKVEVVILDEADRMLDLGFSVEINTLLEAARSRRQTLFFSATMPPAVERLAQFHLTNPVKVDVNPKTIVAETVTEEMHEVRLSERMPKFMELLKASMDADETVLVFAGTKANVEMLYGRLNDDGYPVERIHSGLSQQKRIRVLDRLKESEVRILIATDVASRGLDIPHIAHVINFEMPDTVDEYIHRIGRTGRYDRKGLASSLITPEKRYMIDAIKMAHKKGRTQKSKSVGGRSFRPNRRR